MSRRVLIIVVIFFSFQCSYAQSSLTLGFDGTGLFTAGMRIRYAYSFDYVQLGAYATPGMRTPFDTPNFLAKGGVFVNALSHPSKSVTLYYGGSVEYGMNFIYSFYYEQYYTAGPQLGMNVYLNKRLSFNAEWGARLGLKKNLYTGYLQGGRSIYYYEGNKVAFYLPVSIGVRIDLGRRKK